MGNVRGSDREELPWGRDRRWWLGLEEDPYFALVVEFLDIAYARGLRWGTVSLLNGWQLYVTRNPLDGPAANDADDDDDYDVLPLTDDQRDQLLELWPGLPPLPRSAGAVECGWLWAEPE